jgi:acyl-CoA thioesterase-2
MEHEPTAAELAAQLTALLRVTPLGEDRFEGACAPAAASSGRDRVFGGQVIGQALAAAEATVAEDRPVHSLHAYFLRMGDNALPIAFDVERDLDGGSFSNRRVTASQTVDGARRPILTLAASCQKVEEGLAYRGAMPQVPGPDEFEADHLVRRRHADRLPEALHEILFMPRPIEMRSIDKPWWLDPVPSEPMSHCWIRVPAPVADDPRLHRAMLAYATDLALMPTATLPHGVSGFRGDVMEASLDHAVWFHDDFRIDDWLLYQTQCGWTGRGRGFITGKLWTRDGRLVASVSQEGMIRLMRR